ncbi:MAG: hypothetical protein QM778_21420 [Myxococcales bacterium]
MKSLAVQGMQWALAGAMALLAACGDVAYVGYTRKPVCMGEGVKCEVPENTEFAMTADPRTVPLIATEELKATWSRPPLPSLQPGDTALLLGRTIAGNDGSLWTFGADAEQFTVMQLDGDGNVLGTQQLQAPPGLRGTADDISLSLLYNVSAGIPGPTAALEWKQACQGDELLSCERTELVAFGASVQDAAMRVLLGESETSALEASFLPPFAMREANGADYLALSVVSAGWTTARLSAAGDIEWQQTGFPEGFQIPGALGSALVFSGPQQLTLMGTLSEGGSATFFDLDWHSGNVIKRRGVDFTPSYDAVVRADPEGRLVMASSQNLDLVWGRLAGSAFEQITLLRQDYQVPVLLGLEVGAQGTSYLLTRTGSRDNPVPTLCRLSAALEVSCWRTPELMIGPVVGPGEAVFGVGRNGELLRFDLPTQG